MPVSIRPTRVWDLPTRVFHCALAACVIGSVSTSQIGGEAMPWHFRLGYCTLSLLLFRLVWGFIGGHWSRFGSFAYAPATLLAYLRGQAKPEHLVGHNPLGAGSVFAMLFALFAQVTSGLMSDDDIAYAGPFSASVSNATVRLATAYHKGIGKPVLILLVLLHLGAIAYYHVKKKQNLVKPMVTGDKELLPSTPAQPASRDDAASRWLALGVFALCAAGVYGLIGLAG